ncbi:MAG: zinc-ribbon domain-containing protein [Promethearchaeota archaeon]
MSQTRTPKFCWGCGADLNQGQKFCTRCGKSVSAKKTGVKPQKKTQYGKPMAVQPTHKPVPAKIVVKEEILPTPPTTPTPPTPPSNPSLNKEDLATVKKTVSDLSGLDFSKRFETLEYKINALDSENKLIELKHDVADLKAEVMKANKVNTNVKFEELASKDDLIGLRGQLAENREMIREFKSIKGFDHLEKLERLEELDQLAGLSNRMASIETQLRNFQSDEKLVNLSKNTVTRLNEMDTRLAEFNLENRTRLTKLDERMVMMDEKIDRMSSAVEMLVPSLIKLTEKINRLQASSQSNSTTSKKKSTADRSAAPLDLPPFPKSPQKKPVSEE